MVDDQKHVLHLYAGLLAGFALGFWRGLLLLHREMEELHAAEYDRLTSSLIGMQPLGQACIYAILGGWLFVNLFENSRETVKTECAWQGYPCNHGCPCTMASSCGVVRRVMRRTAWPCHGCKFWNDPGTRLAN